MAASAAVLTPLSPILHPLSPISLKTGEDLEAFAGAGLYDSIPFPALEHRAIEYAGEPLLWDEGLRAGLLGELTSLGGAVEAAFGGVPQVRKEGGSCCACICREGWELLLPRTALRHTD